MSSPEVIRVSFETNLEPGAVAESLETAGVPAWNFRSVTVEPGELSYPLTPQETLSLLVTDVRQTLTGVHRSVVTKDSAADYSKILTGSSGEGHRVYNALMRHLSNWFPRELGIKQDVLVNYTDISPRGGYYTRTAFNADSVSPVAEYMGEKMRDIPGIGKKAVEFWKTLASDLEQASAQV